MFLKTIRKNLGSKIHETSHPVASICRRSSVSRLEEEDDDNTDGHSNSNLNSPPSQMRSGALDLDQVPVSRTSLGECEPTYHMGPEPINAPRTGIRPNILVRRVLTPTEAGKPIGSRVRAGEGSPISDTPHEVPCKDDSFISSIVCKRPSRH